MNQPKDKIRSLIKRLEFVVFDFDGVFTDNHVWVDQSGTETVRCSRADGLGIERLTRIGIPLLVLSTEKNRVVTARCRKLRITCVQGVSDKTRALCQILKKKALTPDRVAFLGNDINDAGCLKMVGLPVIVADADETLKPLCKVQTKKKGGDGAVREFCDLVYSIKEGCNESR